MGKIDNLADDSQETRRLWAAIRKLQTATPLASASVERGRLRFYAGSQLLIEDGNFTVSGTAEITGTLDGSGTFTWTGPVTFTGTTNLNGPVNIAGATHITGATTNSGNFTVDTSGKIIVKGSPDMTIGAVVSGAAGLSFAGGAYFGSDGTSLRLFGGTGGGSVSAGPTFAQLTGPGASKYVIVTSTDTTVTGQLNVTGGLLVSGTPKSFIMKHPIREGWLLQHGSTESPVSGVEYWGDATIGDDGSCAVELPGYFEALTSQDGRSVFVAGRGFSPEWTDIVDGEFAVTGMPGKRFSWLVKAIRADAGFETEHEGTLPGSGPLDDLAASE